MGKSSPAPPPAPDYAGAAQAQGAANVEAAQLSGYMSNPNINSPYGNQTVTWGANNQPTVTQTLTPQAQQTLNAQQQTQTQLANLANQGAQMASGVLGQPFSFGGPQIQTSYGQPGSVSPPPVAGQYGLAGTVSPNQPQAQGGVGGPDLATSLNLGGVANMPVNAGMTGQQAIMNRLEPSLARQRTSTETQLINQGLRPGSEAYNNAIQLLGQQENDARQQAVLEGLNLDLGANQQGYGQALSSGQFGNQAQLAGFGANLQNQQAQNQAIAQNFGQGSSAQAMQNQAIGQNFGQGLSSSQAANAVLAQQYNQGLQSAQFGNTAQQQALAQALQQYNLPVNMISALMSGSQIQNPQFQAYQGQNVAPAPIAQATAQQGAFDQNVYNQQVASANANTVGLYGLGGAALGAYGMINRPPLFG